MKTNITCVFLVITLIFCSFTACVVKDNDNRITIPELTSKTEETVLSTITSEDEFERLEFLWSEYKTDIDNVLNCAKVDKKVYKNSFGIYSLLNLSFCDVDSEFLKSIERVLENTKFDTIGFYREGIYFHTDGSNGYISNLILAYEEDYDPSNDTNNYTRKIESKVFLQVSPLF